MAHYRPARSHFGFVKERAEALPLPASSATVAWALSSVHHWNDRAAGLTEASRVLSPAGPILLAEHLVKPAARGHAANGLTTAKQSSSPRDLQEVAFSEVRTQIRAAGGGPS